MGRKRLSLQKILQEMEERRIDITQAMEVSISCISPNTGQVRGLPANPRTIKNAKYRLLLRSIEEMPGMMGLRELLVYPVTDASGGVQSTWSSEAT